MTVFDSRQEFGEGQASCSLWRQEVKAGVHPRVTLGAERFSLEVLLPRDWYLRLRVDVDSSALKISDQATNISGLEDIDEPFPAPFCGFGGRQTSCRFDGESGFRDASAIVIFLGRMRA